MSQQGGKIIKRGEIYRCDLEPVRGTEKQGRNRPILIIQNDIGNRYSPRTIGVPFTSQFDEDDKEFPVNVFVKMDNINNLEADSIIETSQIRVLDVRKRVGTKMGELSRTDMENVDKALKYSLSLVEICRHCSSLLKEVTEKCPRCRRVILDKCSDCSTLLTDAFWKYCPNCGKGV